jgi:ubiquinone/menaquinone biosynthesis C-methylase UbiE
VQDVNEIVRFDRVFWNVHARTWSDELDRRGREERAARLAAHACRGERILDLGCGTGAYTRALADRGFEVVGLDFAPAMLARARAQAPMARFVKGDLDDPLPFADGSFDHALCVCALQCVGDPVRFLAEVGRVLRPGGVFLAVVVATDSRPVRPAGSGVGAHVFWLVKLAVSRSHRVRRYAPAAAARLVLDAPFELLEQLSGRNATELVARRSESLA